MLRDKSTKADNAPVDIIVRAEDASKIQRIVERFELGKVDKAAIVTKAQEAIDKRQDQDKGHEPKSKNEIIMEEAVRKPIQKEENSPSNPEIAKTDKNPLSRQSLELEDTHTDKGVADKTKKPSVKEKLNQYKAKFDQQKEAERNAPQRNTAKSKNNMTVHKQPKKKKTKER